MFFDTSEFALGGLGNCQEIAYFTDKLQVWTKTKPLNASAVSVTNF